MGFAIWSMHYVGMLAFFLPVRVLYHVPTVILSLIAARQWRRASTPSHDSG